MLKDSRYKMPAQTRKFGGKIYKYLYLGNKADVKSLRSTQNAIRGISVRAVKYGKQLAIYTRGG